MKFDYSKIIIDPEDSRIELHKKYFMARGIVSLKGMVDKTYKPSQTHIYTLYKVNKNDNCPFISTDSANFTMLYPVETETTLTEIPTAYACMVVDSPKALVMHPTLSIAMKEATRLSQMLNTDVVILKTKFKAHTE